MEGAKQADRHLGRCNSQTETMQPPAVTELVAFPGINGPIPEGADSQKWHFALPNGQVQFLDPHILTTCLQSMNSSSKVSSMKRTLHPYNVDAERKVPVHAACTLCGPEADLLQVKAPQLGCCDACP